MIERWFKIFFLLKKNVLFTLNEKLLNATSPIYSNVYNKNSMEGAVHCYTCLKCRWQNQRDFKNFTQSYTFIIISVI